VSTNGKVTSPERRGSDREVIRLIREIQALTLELETLRAHGTRESELRARERAIDQFRWRLAAAARHAASDDLGSAA
jgi:hypothetical protein